MINTLVDAVLIALLSYLIAGVLFSFYFLFKGIYKLDEGVKGTPWHFRLIILLGVVLLWIVLFSKLRRIKS